MKNGTIVNGFLRATIMVAAASVVSQVQGDYTWDDSNGSNDWAAGGWSETPVNATPDRWRLNDTATTGGIEVTTDESPNGGNATLFMQSAGAEQVTVKPSGSLTLTAVNMVWQGGSTSTFIVEGGNLSASANLDMRLTTGDVGAFSVTDGGTASFNGKIRGQDNPTGGSATITVDGPGSTLTVAGNGELYDNIDLTISNGGTLTVGGAMTYEGAALTVGADSTLSLGGATHLFSNGLTIDNGGTLGSSSPGDDTVTSTFDASTTLTLAGGAIIDYSIDGTNGGFDTLEALGAVNLTAGSTVTIATDVVAGDWKLSAGDLTILDFSGADFTPGTASALSDVTWVVLGSNGTRISTPGTFDTTGNILTLSGFQAFAIPEPSTAMLFGMGAMVILLRRRFRR